MSTKFEQLLDFLVNEEHDKANELFHEIVVEKSREIYENLISEEEADEAEMDESKEEADEEEMDEGKEEASDEEEMDESQEDLEDSYNMEQPEDGFGGGEEGDSADAFGQEIGAGSDEESEKSEDDAIFDIKNAIQELEAAFAELEQAQGAEAGSEFGDEEDGEEFGSDAEEEPEDEMMGLREYRDTVGNDWDKNAQKTDGQIAGANTGEKMPASHNGKSAINANADSTKPTSGAKAISSKDGSVGANTGTTPNAKTDPSSLAGSVKGEFTKGVEKNIASSSKTSMKDGAALSKQGAGYPGNNKTPGPVGSGTGDKAGQTSVSNDKSLIKHIK